MLTWYNYMQDKGSHNNLPLITSLLTDVTGHCNAAESHVALQAPVHQLCHASSTT